MLGVGVYGEPDIAADAVRADDRAALDPVPERGADVAEAVDLRLEDGPAVVDGGEDRNLLLGKAAFDGRRSVIPRRASGWRVAALPASAALEGGLEMLLVGLHDAAV